MTTELPTHCVKYTQFLFANPWYEKAKKKYGIAFTGSRTECLEFIKKSCNQVYYLSFDESMPWSLKIKTINSLSPFLKIQAQQFVNNY
jgi:hypothetical protein